MHGHVYVTSERAALKDAQADVGKSPSTKPEKVTSERTAPKDGLHRLPSELILKILLSLDPVDRQMIAHISSAHHKLVYEQCAFMHFDSSVVSPSEKRTFGMQVILLHHVYPSISGNSWRMGHLRS